MIWDDTDPTLQRIADGLKGQRVQPPELPPGPPARRRPGTTIPPQELTGFRRGPDWSSASPSGMPSDPPPFTSASRTRSGRHWNTAEQAKVTAAVAEGVAAATVPGPTRPSRLWQARQLLACVREVLVILLLAAVIAGLAHTGWVVLPSGQ